MDERIAAYKECQDYMKEHYVFIGTNTTVKMDLVTAGLTAPALQEPDGKTLHRFVRPSKKDVL